ncbi:MAG: LacI family DNA-binding transcriptional regulator [Bacillaceae bacterium]|jgi:DNA-binding LacI/PurR family transcriptional regulator|uniref:LacI family transcriptional regulator n=1 Tax=Aeribacillus pallidus TaxID=33936 RepID=A0A165XZF6_9BACI|nr:MULTISPECIES: LacI family DNA-binding transcriptional regulator [Aeribacillus]AXI38797.1 LacI family DNA-binding transcriptional regulator [Bacillaceae bacterium ZC4]REJ19690.1 MAG: LacI family DNA-binding transcriptional regulator [Bacillaceae bacterium]ASS91327.1 LacI family transcriptional regulator [Aeribacillus pallidus]AXI38865.1 LacI family DNA-binding transcriptional regulator [Bacillaceae bacterium ZC4]KZM53540.1 LacI family transcriptional regulator [Aeribacillus pallidus]
MATIRDIAKLAGVSVTTVSRVLNNHPYVSDEKKEAVLKVIEEINYKRNIHAVHLSRGFSNLIGVVLPKIDHPYFSSIVEGISEEAIKHHLQLVLFQTNYEPAKELEALELLRGTLLDGVIFCSRAISFDVLKEYKNAGPIVLCEDSDQSHFPSLSIPHEQAFQFGLDYLISKGHTKIAFTLGRMEGPNSKKRRKAYKTKMKELGEPIRSEWIFDKCLSITDGKQLMEKLQHLEKKPTAFFVTNDQVAAGILLSAEQYKIKIPQDIAILSFDNQPIADIMGITTIEIPIRKMGKLAVQSIIHCKEKREQTNKKMTLPFRLIERKTV